MKRRSFLKSSAFSTAPILLGGIPVATLKHRQLFNFINTDNDKVLVLIELKGGNDGLNTFIPLDQYANLFSARQNIIIPENKILGAGDKNGFHPAMGGMKGLYDNGRLSVIQNVGYENQNRSHFRSIDVWKSASEADEYLTTGWLGRLLDDQHPQFPTGYPNEDNPDPIAITIGSLTSETCQGIGSNFSSAVTNPENLSNLPGSDYVYPDDKYGQELTFLAQSIQQTNAYQTVLAEASAKGSNQSTKYDENGGSKLKEQLKTIARLISGGLRTKIFIASIGGFDTHAFQAESEADTTVGEHAVLLTELSDAIEAFQDDLKAQSLDDRVVGMTFSEFGRRIKSNGSLGTDHGTAAPMFLFGSCVSGGIVGDNPTISSEVEGNEGVAMEIDFKSVYGSVLMDWFDVEESAIKSTLFPDFTYMNLLSGCDSTSTNDPDENLFDITINPNPVRDGAVISMTLPQADWLKMSLFDSIGSQLDVLTNQSIGSGEQTISSNFSSLPAGTYYLRCQFKNYKKSIRFVKV